jgi:hypothetical protein
LRKKSLELDKLNQVKESELQKKTEEISFAIAKQERELNRINEMRDRELKKRQEELDQLYQNHLHDIEKTLAQKEQELRNRLDLDLVDKKREVHQIEAQELALRKDLEQLQQTVRLAKDEHDQKAQALSALKSELEKIRLERTALEQSNQALLNSTNQVTQEKKQAQDQVKDLESRSGHLILKIEEENKKLLNLQKNYEQKAQEAKIKLEDELSKLKKESTERFRASYNVETENAKKMKLALQQEIISKQKQIEGHIHQKIMKIFADHVSKETLTAIDALALTQVKAGFEENMATRITQDQAGQLNTTDMHRKQQVYKAKWVSVGLTAGMALTFGMMTLSNRLEKSNLDKVLAQEQLEREAKRLAAKFEPTQDFELRDNYADSVIYTKDFSVLYEDPQVQERWVRAARDYFFKNWRVDEQKTIAVLSAAKTLVLALEEKRRNINPDFVTEGIQKMHELENESVSEMKAILGTDIKFSAFKKLEKKFFTAEFARRSPAETSSGTPTDESN